MSRQPSKQKNVTKYIFAEECPIRNDHVQKYLHSRFNEIQYFIVREKQISGRGRNKASEVAVDNADDDDDGHTRDDARGQYEPAVFERSRNDVP